MRKPLCILIPIKGFAMPDSILTGVETGVLPRSDKPG